MCIYTCTTSVFAFTERNSHRIYSVCVLRQESNFILVFHGNKQLSQDHLFNRPVSPTHRGDGLKCMSSHVCSASLDSPH